MWTTHQVARADRIPLRQPRIDGLIGPLTRGAVQSQNAGDPVDFLGSRDEMNEDFSRQTKEKQL
jgi:hypothetical protein